MDQKDDSRQERNLSKRFAVIEDLVRGSAPTTTPIDSKPSRETVRAQNLKAGDLLQVPLALLDDNPFNARQIYDPTFVAELAQLIATGGQKVPAVVVASSISPGRYILVDGHYRKQAVREAGLETLACILDTIKDEADLYKLSFMLNEKRHAQTPLDNALAWQRLLSSGSVTKEEDISVLTGLSWPTVNKTLSLLRLPSSVVNKMRENAAKFGVEMSYQLHLYFKALGEVSTLELVDKVLSSGLSQRDVENLRKQAQDPKRRKKKEISRQYKILQHEVAIGVIKDWDSGRILLDIKIPDAAHRQKTLDELRSLLSA